jgi:hypothetical protein
MEKESYDVADFDDGPFLMGDRIYDRCIHWSKKARGTVSAFKKLVVLPAIINICQNRKKEHIFNHERFSLLCACILRVY